MQLRYGAGGGLISTNENLMWFAQSFPASFSPLAHHNQWATSILLVRASHLRADRSKYRANSSPEFLAQILYVDTSPARVLSTLRYHHFISLTCKYHPTWVPSE